MRPTLSTSSHDINIIHAQQDQPYIRMCASFISFVLLSLFFLQTTSALESKLTLHDVLICSEREPNNNWDNYFCLYQWWDGDVNTISTGRINSGGIHGRPDYMYKWTVTPTEDGTAYYIRNERRDFVLGRTGGNFDQIRSVSDSNPLDIRTWWQIAITAEGGKSAGDDDALVARFRIGVPGPSCMDTADFLHIDEDRNVRMRTISGSETGTRWRLMRTVNPTSSSLFQTFDLEPLTHSYLLANANRRATAGPGIPIVYAPYNYTVEAQELEASEHVENVMATVSAALSETDVTGSNATLSRRALPSGACLLCSEEDAFSCLFMGPDGAIEMRSLQQFALPGYSTKGYQWDFVRVQGASSDAYHIFSVRNSQYRLARNGRGSDTREVVTTKDTSDPYAQWSFHHRGTGFQSERNEFFAPRDFGCQREVLWTSSRTAAPRTYDGWSVRSWFMYTASTGFQGFRGAADTSTEECIYTPNSFSYSVPCCHGMAWVHSIGNRCCYFWDSPCFAGADLGITHGTLLPPPVQPP